MKSFCVRKVRSRKSDATAVWQRSFSGDPNSKMCLDYFTGHPAQERRSNPGRGASVCFHPLYAVGRLAQSSRRGSPPPRRKNEQSHRGHHDTLELAYRISGHSECPMLAQVTWTQLEQERLTTSHDASCPFSVLAKSIRQARWAGKQDIYAWHACRARPVSLRGQEREAASNQTGPGQARPGAKGPRPNARQLNTAARGTAPLFSSSSPY